MDVSLSPKYLRTMLKQRWNRIIEEKSHEEMMVAQITSMFGCMYVRLILAIEYTFYCISQAPKSPVTGSPASVIS